ncbi:digestive organ expansion factor [Hysterangium stoloniferum]|nr:digestive organ expansion factor [Hysterangium stoloniferum]
MDDINDTKTQLLTLLNVSAVKRKRSIVEPLDFPKLNKRKKTGVVTEPETFDTIATEVVQPEAEVTQAFDDEDEAHSEHGNEVTETIYQRHFGANSSLVTENVKDCVNQNNWKKTKVQRGKLGLVTLLLPEVAAQQQVTYHKSLQTPSDNLSQVPEKLRASYDSRGTRLSPNQKELRSDVLSALSRYQDLFFTRTELENHSIIRDATSLHALNHIFNIRRRILKNNDRLSHASKGASSEPPSDVQDQGFTRPSVLVLLPFRSSAVRWVESFLAQLPAHQVENRTRFLSEFELPPDAVDKLATAEPGTYPQDHVEMFKGNVDDNFRVGLKLTKKSVKIFASFYQCDLIVASPLGLRLSIEKEKSSDFLSSIELLIVDQMDALTMQNWEHVQFVLSRLNQLPKEAHDADFSRIKPWYLDGLSGYLRQSILFSPYETPEIRAVFNRNLKNVAGKVKTERRWKAVDVPEGVEQKFIKFDCLSPKAEADKRFDFFTTQTLPSILKSAVQSTNTLIFVPSSFDFIRVQNYLRKLPDLSVAILSEYSSNQDISRARQAFFNGKKRFLLVSERFHFFRRYRIRGIRNVMFYSLPDHPQFYTELLSYPFLDEDVQASDITCKVLYCKYDLLRLERIAGSEAAARLVRDS